MSDKPKSVFDNPSFVNGFIDFYESLAFETYMKPFLKEIIELHRDRLETAENAKHFQDRLLVVRQIAQKAESLKRNKHSETTEDI